MPTSSPSDSAYVKKGIVWSQVDWPVVLFIGSTHVLALLAFWPAFFSWSGLVFCLGMIWVTACMGITLCYHRLLTHRSFKTPKWFEYFLTVIACLNWQGGPIQWVGIHRMHHKHSDEDLDPHTPNHGFTWAHMLWCMHKHVDCNGKQEAVQAAKDLERDPVINMLNRYFWLPQFVVAGAAYAIGQYAFNAGWSWVIWGVCVRTVFVYHGTWFVNSAAHTWGYRNYKTQDRSTNLWWVALMSFGEGWHNNHHAYQRSAAHGLRWYELDMTYWLIRVLSVVGLAKDIVLPKDDQMPVGKPHRLPVGMMPADVK